MPDMHEQRYCTTTGTGGRRSEPGPDGDCGPEKGLGWSIQVFADGSAAGRPDDASEWRVLAPPDGPAPAGLSEAALFSATQNRANRLAIAGAARPEGAGDAA